MKFSPHLLRHLLLVALTLSDVVMPAPIRAEILSHTSSKRGVVDIVENAAEGGAKKLTKWDVAAIAAPVFALVGTTIFVIDNAFPTLHTIQTQKKIDRIKQELAQEQQQKEQDEWKKQHSSEEHQSIRPYKKRSPNNRTESMYHMPSPNNEIHSVYGTPLSSPLPSPIRGPKSRPPGNVTPLDLATGGQSFSFRATHDTPATPAPLVGPTNNGNGAGNTLGEVKDAPKPYSKIERFGLAGGVVSGLLSIGISLMVFYNAYMANYGKDQAPPPPTKEDYLKRLDAIRKAHEHGQ